MSTEYIEIVEDRILNLEERVLNWQAAVNIPSATSDLAKGLIAKSEKEIEALRWLLNQVKPAEPVVGELKVGDTVESLIGYITVTKGMQGTVTKVKIADNWQYPIEVRFPSGSLGAHFLDDCVMFNPHELRKV